MKKLIQLLDLTDETCRWPIGDPRKAGFGFCGDPTASGSVYCAEHEAKSLGRGTESERSATRVAPSLRRAA